MHISSLLNKYFWPLGKSRTACISQPPSTPVPLGDPYDAQQIKNSFSTALSPVADPEHFPVLCEPEKNKNNNKKKEI